MPRLYLITPPDIDLATFPARLQAALAGGDIASLLIAVDGVSDMTLQRIAEVLTPIAQDRGVAVLVRNDTRAVGRARADGVHVDTGQADLLEAVRSLQPKSIVGAGGVKTRHDAMAAAEAGVDYVFFGFVDKPEEAEAHPKSLDFADWWMPLFQTPCVCFAGSDPASVDAVAATGADFVAVRGAVWDHPDGPEAAVAEALRRIAQSAPQEDA